MPQVNRTTPRRPPLRLLATLGTVCGTLLATVAVGVTPAVADARNCVASHSSGGAGSASCLTVYGTSVWVRETTVSHYHGGGWGSICNYKARNTGTLPNGSVLTSQSALHSGCAPAGAEPIVRFSVMTTFKNGSYYYGKFYHNGAWTPGDPRVRIIQ